MLQEREVERLGGRKTIDLDVRVLATSNRDLKEAVKEGKFREDLYYRLNVFPLMWLPLNQRPGDIVVLAEHLLARHTVKEAKTSVLLSDSAKQKLLSHSWPGNVRELDNVVQRALILQQGNVVHGEDIFIENYQPNLQLNSSITTNSEVQVETDIKAFQQPEVGEAELADSGNYKAALQDKEHQIILDTLNKCNGKRKDVAEILGMSPRTLRYKLAKMRDMGISLPA